MLRLFCSEVKWKEEASTNKQEALNSKENRCFRQQIQISEAVTASYTESNTIQLCTQSLPAYLDSTQQADC